jgi:hypothetical protein
VLVTVINPGEEVLWYENRRPNESHRLSRVISHSGFIKLCCQQDESLLYLQLPELQLAWDERQVLLFNLLCVYQ